MNALDIDAFTRLYALAYRGLEQYAYTRRRDIRRYFKWLLARDPNGFFVAELDEPIGFIACDTNWFSFIEKRLVGEIHELFVHPAYRNRGVGRTIVQRAIEYARSRGRRLITLWVGRDNEAAKRFYRKLGFIETATYGIWTRMVREA